MSASTPAARVVVVNFNAPELNQLAGALARDGRLLRFVRPYVNKGRAWERAMPALPLAGRYYASTFGRRRLGEPALAALTREAGIAPDVLSAAIGRIRLLPVAWRHRWANRLRMHVREAVAQAGARSVGDAGCVVAYEGFALPAFEAAHHQGGAALMLNYPVAHHRTRRRVRDEENEREPEFATTWPGFDDWGPGHEERLDREIDLADTVLLGSSYAADTFIAEGVPARKLKVVPYGVDLETFTPAQTPAPASPFRVIYAGQLTQRKGIAYLLRGYAQFRRPDTELVLVGSVVGSHRPLERYASMFTHVEHQTRPALAQRYRDAHVFVLPTLIEGMPLVMLEAMACGLPVVVTANGPAGIMRDGVDGIMIPERSSEAVADALDRLYRDPERRVWMSRQAAARAREFGWPVYARGVADHIDSVAGLP